MVGEVIGWIWAVLLTIGLFMTLADKGAIYDGTTDRTLIGIPFYIVFGITPRVVVALLCRKYRNKPNATITPPEPSIKSM